MIKKPNIVNMTLTSTKPFKSLQIQNDASINNSGYPHSLSDDTIIKDVMQFVQIITTQKTKIKAKENRTVKASKQGKRSPKKGLKQQAISIPMDLSLSVETVLRKYLLYKVEQKQENTRNGIPKAKMIREKNINLRNPFYKTNKENTQGNQQIQQIEEDVFRSIATNQAQKQKLNAKISLLEAQNIFLKQSIEEKNQTISKLLIKQAQMKKKYTDEITRMTRNKNIYNISAGFDRQESQGKFLMSITGRHLKQANLQEENCQKESIALHGGVEVRILPRSGSDYLKGIRGSGQIDIKKHLLKGYKKNLAESNLLQNMNKTLQIEQGTPKQLQFSIKQVKNHNLQAKDKSLPNYFQGFTDSPKIFEEQNVFENYSKQNVEVIKNMKQEEFQALQQKGFYVQNAQKSVGSII